MNEENVENNKINKFLKKIEPYAENVQKDEIKLIFIWPGTNVFFKCPKVFGQDKNLRRGFH